MYFVKKTPAEKRTDLQKKLKKGKLVRFPGAYNPLVAKLIEEIGYEGIYISGAVMANDLGIPDIGLTTLTEVSYRAEQIARVTNLPSIVDADTGFGEPMNFILVKGGYTEKDQNSIYHNHFINDFTEMNGILSKMKFLN